MKKKEKKFIADLKSYNEITFIGPLFSGPLLLPRNESPFVVIDGGCHHFTDVKSNYLKSFKNFLFLKLGDQDSYDGELDLVLEKNKDFSDLTYGLGLITDTIETISLQGFLGGRKDHELFNLGEVHHFLSSSKAHKNCSVTFEKTFQAFPKGTQQIDHQGTFSLFVLEKTLIQIEGNAKYTLKGPTLFNPLSSMGLSNIGNGSFTITSQGPFFLYFQD